MSFADWKKRSKRYQDMMAGHGIGRADAEEVAQAAYKAGERDGPRKVAGLAADAGGVKTKKHTVTLDAFTVAFLELLGDGNLSRGIREATRKLAPKKTPPNATAKGRE